MYRFTFRSNNGSEVVVEANTEEKARTKAMKKLWGGENFSTRLPKPGTNSDFNVHPYHGTGLDLIKEVEI